MAVNREHILKSNTESVLLLIVLSVTFMICVNSHSNFHEKEKSSAAVNYSLNRNLAVIYTATGLPAFQKNWITVPGKFMHFSERNTLILENRKVHISYSLLRNVQQSLVIIPVYIYHYHLFSAENDETPLLS